MPKIVSIIVAPWSSVIGQSISLLAEDGRCVATLNVHAATDPNPRKAARAAAERIAEAFNALSEKETAEELLGKDE
jgi:DNA-binding IclR family transcriptional regulator